MRHSTVVAAVALTALVALTGGAERAGADDVGSLVVESDPKGAAVYVDGRPAGETPLIVEAIAAGVHRVRLVRAGYLENSRLVTVKAGARGMVRAQLTAAAPSLKIIVVEGEGAVNIIQQKTAVAPVIEVRDRNDQPVSGAVVRFAIQKGRATFNGARTLTATTDALGRATATGLTPIGNGPLQIGASAAFQGQTAAISIAQTNVLTAAQASSAAVGGGGTAGGGGGLSHLAIAGIVGGAGAAVGGAVLAKKLNNDPCGDSALCGSWQVSFATPPGLDISVCDATVQGLGLNFQFIDVAANGAFVGTWARPPSLRVDGTMTPTSLNGTLHCLSTPATGTMSATASGGDYLGVATLGGKTVSVRVVKGEPF